MKEFLDDVTGELRGVFKNAYILGNAQSLETAIKKLKHLGCTQMQTLKVLMVELSLGIKEADCLVLNSEAWSPEKAGNLQFRKDFEKYVRRGE